jgi:hypothetical protein
VADADDVFKFDGLRNEPRARMVLIADDDRDCSSFRADIEAAWLLRMAARP